MPRWRAGVKRRDGTVHQLAIDSGSDQASARVGTGPVTDIYLDTADGSAVDRMGVLVPGQFSRFCIPWQPGAGHS